MAVELDNPVAVRRVAMDLLARREHGRAELSRKLRQRGATQDLIDPALDRLAEEGLLNESRYLESYIASEELSQRGLPRGEIDAALSESGVDWSENLREVWRRKFARLPQDARERAQQGRFLSYRGYSMEAISRLLSGRRSDD